MTYIRHRQRMIAESVFEDLTNTLIACRWAVGTTSREVVNPTSGDVEVITTTVDDVFPLTEGHPITVIDYFPESEGEQTGPTEPNTFAMDSGRPGDPEYAELGSSLIEQPYLFNYAFFAISDAVAEAVFSDLQDRYLGRIVQGDYIDLYNYLDDPTESVVRMEVEAFRFTRDMEAVAPAEVHLYFAELSIVDYVS